MPEISRAKGYVGKRILVTGGAGAIGSNLARILDERGAARVVVLDNLSSSCRWNLPTGDSIAFIDGDIRDDKALFKAFLHRPEYVFHLAAHFANQNSVDNPEENLSVNGLGALKVFQRSRSAGVNRVVYASSGCGVYGPGCTMPFEEQDVSLNLYTPYQVTKLLGELYANYFHNLYGLPVVNARLFNVFGPGEVPGRYRNVIPNFVFWAMQGKPLPITGDGSETRDWTYVDDSVAGLLEMGISAGAVGETINLASGRETTVLEMAELVNELTGNRAGMKFTQPRGWDKKPRLLGSIDKAARILHYQPSTPFRTGVEAVCTWFADNWNEISKSAEF